MCFRDPILNLYVKFGAYMCYSGRIMAVKAKFQNGGLRHLGFYRKSNLTAKLCPGRDFESWCKILYKYVQKRPSYSS